VLLSRDAGEWKRREDAWATPSGRWRWPANVSHREEIDRVIGLTVHHFQRIDVWVNNAGHGLLDSVAEMDLAACRAMFDTNFFGAVAGMQAVIQ